MLYLPKPLGFASGSKRRRHRRSARYRIRGRPRSTSCTRFPCTRSFLRFWPKTGSGARCVNPSSEGSSKASTADPLPEGYCSFTTRTTRSGKNYWRAQFHAYAAVMILFLATGRVSNTTFNKDFRIDGRGETCVVYWVWGLGRWCAELQQGNVKPVVGKRRGPVDEFAAGVPFRMCSCVIFVLTLWLRSHFDLSVKCGLLRRDCGAHIIKTLTFETAFSHWLRFDWQQKGSVSAVSGCVEVLMRLRCIRLYAPRTPPAPNPPPPPPPPTPISAHHDAHTTDMKKTTTTSKNKKAKEQTKNKCVK